MLAISRNESLQGSLALIFIAHFSSRLEQFHSYLFNPTRSHLGATWHSSLHVPCHLPTRVKRYVLTYLRFCLLSIGAPLYIDFIFLMNSSLKMGSRWILSRPKFSIGLKFWVSYMNRFQILAILEDPPGPPSVQVQLVIKNVLSVYISGCSMASNYSVKSQTRNFQLIFGLCFIFS
jgi:hypothetical protein